MGSGATRIEYRQHLLVRHTAFAGLPPQPPGTHAVTRVNGPQLSFTISLPLGSQHPQFILRVLCFCRALFRGVVSHHLASRALTPPAVLVRCLLNSATRAVSAFTPSRRGGCLAQVVPCAQPRARAAAEITGSRTDSRRGRYARLLFLRCAERHNRVRTTRNGPCLLEARTSRPLSRPS